MYASFRRAQAEARVRLKGQVDSFLKGINRSDLEIAIETRKTLAEIDFEWAKAKRAAANNGTALAEVNSDFSQARSTILMGYAEAVKKESSRQAIDKAYSQIQRAVQELVLCETDWTTVWDKFVSGKKADFEHDEELYDQKSKSAHS